MGSDAVTGNKDKLQLHDSVETEHPLEGEQFLIRLWADRKHRPRSEIYRLTEAEVAAGMAELRHYVLPGELVEREQILDLEEADNTDTMIEPSQPVKEAHRRLVEIEGAGVSGISRSSVVTATISLDDALIDQVSRLHVAMSASVRYALKIRRPRPVAAAEARTPVRMPAPA
ncbi:hypothetical protein F5X71_24910 [Nocardia brasiliensis]|uniref:Uncharacterized protein n=1 Tax=Nocardia brasiliensis TaxID=37326 RepID=A0A6G9XW54_NOCBR|nr:hypothetical protein [Nocardia brasiliensis]QIS05126.1 hypothetical protein F5X71_24910 [Nocardia brasiliensis]